MTTVESILSIIQCMCKNIQDQPSWIDHVYYIDHTKVRPAPISDSVGNYIYFRPANFSAPLVPVLNSTKVIAYEEKQRYRMVCVLHPNLVNRQQAVECVLSALQACTSCVRGDVQMFWDVNDTATTELNFYRKSVSAEERTKFLNSLTVDLLAFEFNLSGEISIHKCNCQPCATGGGTNDYYPSWL